MFHHFDLVALAKPVAGVDVPVGATGTVIRVFGWVNPTVYHVAFYDMSQEALGAFRVCGDDALVLKHSVWQQLKGLK
jgi:hypothetical protein